MSDIRMECTCLTENARWELWGVLNTVRLLAENNQQRIEEDIKREGEKPYLKMAREKLKHDIDSIKALRTIIDEIPLCKPR